MSCALNNNIVLVLSKDSSEQLKKFLKDEGAEFLENEKNKWRARFEDAVLSFYQSGKLVIQGKSAKELAEEIYLRGFSYRGEVPEKFDRWIGIDEAGKGDYFGPLVVAGVLMEREKELELIKLGVRDSKNLSDNMVRELYDRIKKLVLNNILVIGPQKYNELYEKLRNLNKILAWGHSRVLENLLLKENCAYAISDQFANKAFLENALMKRGKEVMLIQKPSAEKDLAVASASILARAEFIFRLEGLASHYKLSFPPGASDKVVEAGKRFVRIYGRDVLRDVAKLHFKTTKLILQ